MIVRIRDAVTGAVGFAHNRSAVQLRTLRSSCSETTNEELRRASMTGSQRMKGFSEAPFVFVSEPDSASGPIVGC